MQFSFTSAHQSVILFYKIYGNLVYFLPMFLVASLWLLSSQKRAFMSKLDEFINDLERAEKLARDDKENTGNDEENGRDADIGDLELKELVEEEEKSKVKLA